MKQSAKKRMTALVAAMTVFASVHRGDFSVYAEEPAESIDNETLEVETAETTESEEPVLEEGPLEAETGESTEADPKDASETPDGMAEEETEAAPVTERSAGMARVPGAPAPEYEFTVYWTNTVSASSTDYQYDDAADPDHRHLIMVPSEDRPRTATVHVDLKLNGDAGTVHPAGSIKMIVPSQIFEAWDGGTANAEHMTKALTQLSWQIPQAPAQSNISDFNWSDNGDGTYILSNFQALTGGAQFSFEQAFTMLPNLVKVDENGTYLKDFDLTLKIDQDADGMDDIEDAQSLTVETRQKTDAPVLELRQSANTANKGAYFFWDPAWGKEPADADDYFYIPWQLDYSRHYTDTIPNVYDVKQEAGVPGEVIGVIAQGRGPRNSNNIGFEQPGVVGSWGETLDQIARPGYESALHQTGLYGRMQDKTHDGSLFGSVANWNNWTMSRFTVLKRYPKTMLEEAKKQGVDLARDGLRIENKMSVTQTLENGKQNVVTAEAEARVYLVPYAGYAIIRKNNHADMTNGHDNVPGARTFLLNDEDVMMVSYSNQDTWVTSAETAPLKEPVWKEAEKDYDSEVYTTIIKEAPVYYLESGRTDYTPYREIGADQFHVVPDGSMTYHSVWFQITGYDASKSELGAWTLNQKGSRNYSKMKEIRVFGTKTTVESDDPDADPTPYELLGTVTMDAVSGKLTYRSVDGNTVVEDVKEGNPIFLPEGYVGLKYESDSTFYRTHFKAYTKLNIHPTEQMKEWCSQDIAKNRSTYFVSYAKLRLKQGDRVSTQSDSRYQPLRHTEIYLTSLGVTTSADKNLRGVIKDDVIAGVQTAPVRIKFGQYTSLWDRRNPKRDYLKAYIYESGTLYDLLPLGTSVDLKSIKLWAGQWSSEKIVDPALYTVEMIEDWEGSGQTMMKLYYDKLPDQYIDPANYTNHGFALVLYYDLLNSYNNISDRGVTVLNEAAFLPGNDAVQNRDNLKSHYMNFFPKKEPFEALRKERTEYWDYISAKINYNPVTVKQSGAIKKVANDHDNLYSDKTHVYPSNPYTYQLSFYTSNSTRADQIVLYDILDDSLKVQSDWQGKFSWIDLTSVTEKESYGLPSEKCAPVVYYSSKVPTEQEMDISLSDVWSTTKPEDVKAIAVDCTKTTAGNPFILDQGMGLNVYVHMIAPNDKTLEGKTAVNTLQSYARTFVGTAAPAGDAAKEYDATARVIYHDLKLELHKESDPVTGTDAAPTEIANVVDTPVTYKLTIRNNDMELDVRNVRVEDPIPEGLEADPENAKVTSAVLKYTNKKVADASDIGLIIKDGKAIISITDLPKDGTVELSIPTKLKKEVIRTTKFVNTAKLTSAEGLPQDITSETTYHKAVKLYELEYVVLPDPIYGFPATADATPAKKSGIEYGTVETLAGRLSTTEKKAGTVKGFWTFKGWSSAKEIPDTITSLKILKNEVVYGQWVFTPARDLEVVKKWLNPAGTELSARETPAVRITVTLYRNGQPTGKQLVLSADNRWSASFDELPVSDPLTKAAYDYTVKEEGVDLHQTVRISGRIYEVSVSGTMDDGFTVSNKQKPTTGWYEVPDTGDRQ